jgi:hypothetical protein
MELYPLFAIETLCEAHVRIDEGWRDKVIAALVKSISLKWLSPSTSGGFAANAAL